MARKPVLEGGKREEILDAAIGLFFKNGYEGTSIRMILNEVGGEIGMFYHYFTSKQELFDKAVEHFMDLQSKSFIRIMTSNKNDAPGKKIEHLLTLYAVSMEKFHKLAGGTIHWSILSALHDRTVDSMLPAVKEMILNIYQFAGTTDFTEVNWLSPFILKGISGLLHDTEFSKLPKEQQQIIISTFICRNLQIPLTSLNPENSKNRGDEHESFSFAIT